MSASRIVGAILQLALAIFLILYGIATGQHGVEEMSADEPFGEYQNLQDCIAKNYGKRRDPEQYCRAILRKVQRARRRKYGRI